MYVLTWGKGLIIDTGNTAKGFNMIKPNSGPVGR